MLSTLSILESIGIMFLTAFICVIKPIPKKAKSLVVLLNNGKIQNAINVSNEKGSTHIDKIGGAVTLKDSKTAISKIKIMSKEEIEKKFSKALSASPKKALHYILYFKKGQMQLTKTSENTLTKALQSIKNYAPCIVDLIGHTDTAGSAQGNLRISLKRSNYIKNLIENQNINIYSLLVKGYGEEDLLVPTANNIHEAKNRNVEIVIK